MRLLGQVSREYEGKDGKKEYYQHWIIVPNKVIEKLGWKVGEELDMEVKHGKLVVEKD